MKKLMCKKGLIIALAVVLPGLTLAAPPKQKAVAATGSGMAVAGYTDATGKILPGGDTRMELRSEGGTTTLSLANLYAYGEAGIKRLEPGKRQAWYGSNPEYFRGGTVYVLKLGDDWRGERTAASVKLDADKGLVVLAKAPIGDDTVVLTFPSRKAGSGMQFDCQPVNFLLAKADGGRAWLGHPGWAKDNTDAAIGDYMVLVNNDQRYPATVLCYDGAGNIVPVTPAMRADLAKIIQPPADADKPITAAQVN